MNFEYLNNKNKKLYLSFALSALTHVFIFLLLAFLLGIKIKKPIINPIFLEFNNITEYPRDEFETSKSEPNNSQKLKQMNENTKELVEPIKQVPLNYYLFSDLDADTSDLQQVYYETTLDVTIKYPAGWTFIDQNVKNKLDGVTFWLINSEIKPPPYVHLEVLDKYLFNPAKFNDSLKVSDFWIYYAEPKELEGQITQVLYIRTDIDVDFSLKIMVNNWENYRNFQPKLLGMLKTFDFKRSLF
ncbi:MAG TPA: hypothetical protein PKA80_07520 [Ignavibacteriaceae bacterium]|nr:hypothetical protein [Ignavibacteriaceae bacterium]